MMLRKKSLKLSLPSRVKTITKRQKARAKRLSVLLVSLSVLISSISIVLIVALLGAISKPPIVSSPIAKSYTEPGDIHDRYQSALKNLLKKNNINYISVGSLRDGLYEIKLSDSSVVVVTSQKDLNLQISSLQYMLSRLTMEGKRFNRLDLRFDKPVIVLK